MINSAKSLNWFIGGYVTIRMFGYLPIVKAEQSLQILFVMVPISLLIWQTFILRERFREVPEHSASAIYQRVDTGDWWRIFFILGAGHRPLASQYVWGFFLFTGLVAVLLVVLIFTASVEFYKRRTATPMLIGCLVFAYFLLSWQKNTYVIHYGVPIIGHFLEKPEYDATYHVEIHPEHSNRTYQAIADIHVRSRKETDDFGEEDELGQVMYHTFTYRDVWIKRLYLPSGETENIADRSEPLHLGESVFVADSHGRWWFVKLVDQPVRPDGRRHG